MLQENLPYRDLDLVTNRNNLCKLLRCIDQQRDKAFRIDADLVGKTCLILLTLKMLRKLFRCSLYSNYAQF